MTFGFFLDYFPFHSLHVWPRVRPRALAARTLVLEGRGVLSLDSVRKFG